MSIPCRARVPASCLAALVVLLAARVPEGKGQPPLHKPDAEPLPPAPDLVLLTTDTLLARKLDAAGDYIKVKAWAEAVRLLQSVLDAREDGFLKVPLAEAPARGAPRWVSARARAERLLAGMPPAGREFYQLTYEGAARALLARARASADRAALHEAVRRFRYTRAGAEALALLGTYYLDRGQPDLAAACFQRLLEGAERDSVSPALLFQAAVAFQAAGNRGQEEPTWTELTRQLRSDGLRLGKRTLPIAELRQVALRLAPPPGPAEDWPLYRGDARRAAAAPAVPFLLEPSLSLPTAEGESRRWLQQARRAAPPGSLPGAVPLAVGGRIVYRGADGLHALDADSGREAWRAASPLALDTLLREPGRMVQVQNWFGLYGPTRALLYENSTLGTLASDGRNVYAVEDLPLPPHPDLILAQMGGQSRSLGPLRQEVQHNRLRAIDLASGQVRWEVGGPRGAGGLPPPRGPGGGMPPPGRARPVNTNLGDLRGARRGAPGDSLADAFFLGPPLPLGGDLFVLVEKQQDLELACLDADSGEVRWTQSLAAAGDKILINVLRHTHAVHLAYGDGVLVCPTHSGAILGIDPLTRSFRWAHVYREPTTAPEAEPAFNAGTLPAAWRGSAPVVHDGRVVLTAPDSDALLCLRLRDGALLWKALQTADDLFVAGVLGDKVLVVGRTACRALSLTSGQAVWQQATALPSGQGVAAGKVYYLPLADGGVLALDVEEPRATVRIEPGSGPAGEPPGNLVFHRGVLWSQGPVQLTAYLPLDARLRQVEGLLAAVPNDGPALAERGRLRLAKGDVAGAAADLYAALDRLEKPQAVTNARARLYDVLGQLLQRDFTTGEKYLDDYRRLCALVPSGGRPPDEEEQRQRRQHLGALVARGRESQGRVIDALQAYADVLDRARRNDLLAVPEDPALRVRPDVWTRGRVAILAGTSAAGRLHAEIERRWRDLLAEPRPAASPDRSLARFLALFGSVADGPGAAAAREARLRWAQELAESPCRAHAIDAELLLHAVENEEAAAPQAARALEARARLLLRQGILGEAADCYRRLGSEFPRVEIADGRTGADVLAEAAQDRRLLLTGDLLRPPQARRLSAGRMKVVELPGKGPLDVLVIPLVPRTPYAPASPGTLGSPVPPPFVRGFRFFLDGRALQLLAVDRDTGVQRFAVPLPLATFPPYLRGNELPSEAVDHLLLVAVGPTLLAIDLLERRVRWSYPMLDEVSARWPLVGTLPDGTCNVNPGAGQTIRQMGWVGPAGRAGLFVHNHAGLTCLDTATGAVRWVRSDVPAQVTVFGDGERLYLAEHNGATAVRGVRAVRMADGAGVAIPDATPAYSHRLRVLGRRLLVSEEGPDREVRLRLYDLPSGGNVWSKEFPAGSLVLSAPLNEWAGVAAPDGTVTVVDLAAARETRLALDRRHLDRVTAGHLFADAGRVYVALQGPGDGTSKILDGPNTLFRAGLVSAPVNGLLYAFDRASGELLWYSPTPAQTILLERFDELPIVLCAAMLTRQGANPGEAVGVVALRSIDKQTGKVIFNKESQQGGEPFHTLQIDPRAGTVDLLSPPLVLRHQAVRKP